MNNENTKLTKAGFIDKWKNETQYKLEFPV